MTDAFAAFSGFDLNSEYSTVGKIGVGGGEAKIVVNGKEYNRAEWNKKVQEGAAGFSGDFDTAFANAQRHSQVKTLKADAHKIATNNANAIYSTENTLKNVYGWDDAKIAEVSKKV
jgi:hypothetical protein